MRTNSVLKAVCLVWLVWITDYHTQEADAEGAGHGLFDAVKEIEKNYDGNTLKWLWEEKAKPAVMDPLQEKLNSWTGGSWNKVRPIHENLKQTVTEGSSVIASGDPRQMDDFLRKSPAQHWETAKNVLKQENLGIRILVDAKENIDHVKSDMQYIGEKVEKTWNSAEEKARVLYETLAEREKRYREYALSIDERRGGVFTTSEAQYLKQESGFYKDAPLPETYKHEVINVSAAEVGLGRNQIAYKNSKQDPYFMERAEIYLGKKRNERWIELDDPDFPSFKSASQVPPSSSDRDSRQANQKESGKTIYYEPEVWRPDDFDKPKAQPCEDVRGNRFPCRKEQGDEDPELKRLAERAEKEMNLLANQPDQPTDLSAHGTEQGSSKGDMLAMLKGARSAMGTYRQGRDLTESLKSSGGGSCPNVVPYPPEAVAILQRKGQSVPPMPTVDSMVAQGGSPQVVASQLRQQIAADQQVLRGLKPGSESYTLTDATMRHNQAILNAVECRSRATR